MPGLPGPSSRVPAAEMTSAVALDLKARERPSGEGSGSKPIQGSGQAAQLKPASHNMQIRASIKRNIGALEGLVNFLKKKRKMQNYTGNRV